MISDTAYTEKMNAMTLPELELRVQLLPEQITKVLSDAIISGRIKGGAQLIEADLQQRFGISRTPLREAFRDLEKKGFVEILPRRGAFVKTVSKKDAEEVYLVRVNLEAMAARLAFNRMTPKCLSALEAELKGMEAAWLAQETDRYLGHHDNYHDILIRHSDNAVLVEILEKLRTHTNWHRFYFTFHETDFEAALNTHRCFQEVLSDPTVSEKRVEKIFREHILAGLRRFKRHLEGLDLEERTEAARARKA